MGRDRGCSTYHVGVGRLGGVGFKSGWFGGCMGVDVLCGFGLPPGN